MTATLAYAPPDLRAGTGDRRRAAVLGLSITALTLVAMLAFTWRTWPDPTVDFGRELYVPWQLAQAKVLYRDIAHFNGPLSQYFNAVVFRVFGASLMTLAWTNIVILAAFLLILHRLLASLADEFAATVACVAVTILLATGQPGPAPNYNFVCPYSHELTHGIVLSVGMLACLRRFQLTRRIGWTIGAGLLLGLTLLTKPEVSVAAIVSGVLGLALLLRDHPRRRLVACVFATATVAPLLLTIVLLSLAISPREAIIGVFGAWRWALDRRVNNLAFYRRVRGTLDPVESLTRLLVTSLGWSAIVLAPFVVGRVGSNTRRPIAFLLSLIVAAAVLAACWNLIAWEDVGRPLLITSLLLVVWCWRRAEPVALAFSFFALLLLPKTALNVQLYHYGFALALPALALTIVAATCWLPSRMNRQGRNGAFVRGAVVGALLVLCARYVAFMHQRYQNKTTLVGAGANAFRADERGRSVNAMVATLRRLPAGETVATVPQGLMVNFLAGRTSSSKYLVLMPPEVMMFGADRIRDDWRSSPPDDVLVIATDFAEYGAGDFDTGYGAPLYDWMSGHYRLALRSDDPAQPWMLLRRNGTQ